ncbi:MAG TPA: IS200/IS605 family transposase [Terriglobia bacterium]|nr:IS200/IS605 family transposase [Terriglobia bacterium]
MSQTLVKLLVHIVFSTKDRRNLITAEIEPELFAYMAGTLKQLDCPCLAINGATNHVHILISLSKNIALSKMMEELKKSSSKWIKTKGENFRDFAWQEGYGVFSIGESNIEALKKYIAKQKAHHKVQQFETEFLDILKKYRVKHDPRYIWL